MLNSRIKNIVSIQTLLFFGLCYNHLGGSKTIFVRTSFSMDPFVAAKVANVVVSLEGFCPPAGPWAARLHSGPEGKLLQHAQLLGHHQQVYNTGPQPEKKSKSCISAAIHDVAAEISTNGK